MPSRRTPRRLSRLRRICPEKRPDHAIEIARRTGVPLKIAAKVDRVDQAYFDEVIRPLLRDPLIEYVGEIGERDKAAFLGDALALLFPIDWPEPFGLVMIEAMACGTPVIGYRRGSVPEVLDHGWTGFVVDDIAGASAAVADLDRLDRRMIRKRFEQRFTAERMAKDYVAVYDALAAVLAMPATTPLLSRGAGMEKHATVKYAELSTPLEARMNDELPAGAEEPASGAAGGVLHPGDVVAAGGGRAPSSTAIRSAYSIITATSCPQRAAPRASTTRTRATSPACSS